MKRLLSLLLLASTLTLSAEDETEAGFLTQYLNRSIERAMTPAPDSARLRYGRDVSRFVSAPQFGGYIVGQYSYSSQEGQHGGDGFSARHVRAYVSGTVLRDFRYRFQMEFRGTPALRDYTIEWVHWREFAVKVGQFKRPFTFDSPLNPWTIGLGGFSNVTRKLVGYGDYCGEANMNGRDQGLMFHGDLLPVGESRRPLLRYEAGIYNGNGQNQADNNRRKDFMGSIQVMPIDGLKLGIFGWKGNFKRDDITVGRNRWAVGAVYEKKGWTARAEYVHHVGHKLSDYDVDTQTWSGRARADGWYALFGAPVTDWFIPYVRYDAYRDRATWSTLRTTYSICPNFRLHKNLLFQLQYNFVNDKTAADHHYSELWAQAYIRF